MSKYRISMDGKIYEMEVELIGEGNAAASQIKKEENKAPVSPERKPVVATTAGTKTEKESSGTVKSPMPGTVIKLCKKSGDQVKNGETVLILEAMKMENEIVAPRDGVIINLYASEGQTIAGGEAIFDIQ